MTFLDRQTTREAQAVRRSVKDRKGRPAGKYDTPDRPGTALGWSTTGQGNGAMSDIQRAFAEVDLPDNLKPRKRKPARKAPAKRPADKRPASKPKGKAQSVNITVHPSVNTPTNSVTGKPGPGAAGAAAAMRIMAAKSKARA